MPIDGLRVYLLQPRRGRRRYLLATRYIQPGRATLDG
jgi:hypothetical protein